MFWCLFILSNCHFWRLLNLVSQTPESWTTYYFSARVSPNVFGRHAKCAHTPSFPIQNIFFGMFCQQLQEPYIDSCNLNHCQIFFAYPWTLWFPSSRQKPYNSTSLTSFKNCGYRRGWEIQMVIDNQKWRMATCQHDHTLSYWACLQRKRRNAMQLLINWETNGIHQWSMKKGCQELITKTRGTTRWQEKTRGKMS